MSEELTNPDTNFPSFFFFFQKLEQQMHPKTVHCKPNEAVVKMDIL